MTRTTKSRDQTSKWWTHKVSRVGVLILALGISSMIGFASWHAAQDTVTALPTGPTGPLGNQTVGQEVGSSAIASWVAVLPNGLLFLGLSFGMIVSIAFASFSLGLALQAFNIITSTPRIGNDVKDLIEAASVKIARFRKLRDEDDSERRKLPFDIKVKFARLAAHAGWKAAQSKLAAARRKFHPHAKNNPLASIASDPAAGAIPSWFEIEAEFARHIYEIMD